jgi:hypothetical protein
MVYQMLVQIPGIKARYDTTPNGSMGELQWLADRIAKNRERLGVHYPSDSQAGAMLAEWLVADLVGGTVTSGVFDDVLAHAKDEWQ